MRMLNDELLLAGDGIPDSDFAWGTAAAGQTLAVTAIGHGLDPRAVSHELPLLLAGQRVPDLHGLIIAGRSGVRAIGAESDGGHGPGMTLEVEHLRAGRGVPNLDLPRLVEAGDIVAAERAATRHEPLSIWAEGDARDHLPVPLQR
jgi:hypothetical protein